MIIFFVDLKAMSQVGPVFGHAWNFWSSATAKQDSTESIKVTTQALQSQPQFDFSAGQFS
jgi:hypothetical protein